MQAWAATEGKLHMALYRYALRRFNKNPGTRWDLGSVPSSPPAQAKPREDADLEDHHQVPLGGLRVCFCCSFYPINTSQEASLLRADGKRLSKPRGKHKAKLEASLVQPNARHVQEKRRESTSSSVTELEAEGHEESQETAEEADSDAWGLGAEDPEEEEEEEVELHESHMSVDTPAPPDPAKGGLQRRPHIDEVETQVASGGQGLMSDDEKPSLKDRVAFVQVYEGREVMRENLKSFETIRIDFKISWLGPKAAEGLGHTRGSYGEEGCCALCRACRG